MDTSMNPVWYEEHILNFVEIARQSRYFLGVSGTQKGARSCKRNRMLVTAEWTSIRQDEKNI